MSHLEARKEMVYTKQDFSFALEKLKQGAKVSREGWNGKGMFVIRQKAYPQGIPCNKQTAEAWNLNEGDLFKCEPYLQVKTVNGSHSMWIPNLDDIFAEDWEVRIDEDIIGHGNKEIKVVLTIDKKDLASVFMKGIQKTEMNIDKDRLKLCSSVNIDEKEIICPIESIKGLDKLAKTLIENINKSRRKSIWGVGETGVDEKKIVEGGIVNCWYKDSGKSKKEVLKDKLSRIPEETWTSLGCAERCLPLFKDSGELEIVTNIVYSLDGLNLSKVKDILNKVDKSIDHILKI